MVDLDRFPEADHDLIAQLEPVFQEYLEALLRHSEDSYYKAMTYAKTGAAEELRHRENRTRGIPNIGMG